MAHIGNFTRTQDGYCGRLRTLTIDVELTLVPANAGDGENAPDFRIHAGDSADVDLIDGDAQPMPTDTLPRQRQDTFHQGHAARQVAAIGE